MSLSPPSAKQRKQDCPIDNLTSAELSEVIKRLPPGDRLVASEVCRRWYELSRKAWLDVKQLDLSSIPGANICAVIKQCPNVQSVIAVKKSFELNELASLTRSTSLSSVKLYECTCAVESDQNVVNDVFAKIFSADLQDASWSELVLYDVSVNDKASSLWLPSWAFSAAYLPASLTRLQLSGLRIGIDSDPHCGNMFLFALQRLRKLECLMLHDMPFNIADGNDSDDEMEQPDRLENLFAILRLQKNLKELFIEPSLQLYENGRHQRFVSCLPKLEVLFLNNVTDPEIGNSLAELITNSSVLRILVLSGKFRPYWLTPPIDIPARNRFPNGFDSAPLPLLHIFVGDEASERIRFGKSASDAAIIYPMNQPVAKFLEREDIAELFKGVWVAEKIKETVKIAGEDCCFSVPTDTA